MAKTTCPKCGHKNKSKEKICANCGFYIGQEQIAPPLQSSSNTAVTGAPAHSQDSYSVSTGGSSVIEVRDTTGTIVKVAMGAAYVVVFGLLALVYLINLNPFYVLPLIIATWGISPILRRRFSGVSFTQTGFTIKGKNMSREFNYDSIVSGEVLNTVKGRRLLQLSLKNVQQPVTLEVFSFNTFRTLLTQMTRRGISITAENQAGSPGPSRMM